MGALPATRLARPIRRPLRQLTPLCPNLRHRAAGDFEGVVSFGLGLRRKTGFRVFRLTGPTRIVIDVLH